MGDVIVAFGTIEVGQCLPAACDDSEVVEPEMLGMLQQDGSHRLELVTNSRVGAETGDLVRLRHADATQAERFDQLGDHIEGLGEFAESGRIGTGSVGLGGDPLLHRPVPVECVELSLFAHSHDAGHLSLDRPSLHFEITEPGCQRIVVELTELVDDGGPPWAECIEHMTLFNICIVCVFFVRRTAPRCVDVHDDSLGRSRFAFMTSLQDRPDTALMVIDKQRGVVADAHEIDRVVDNINAVIERMRE